MNGGLNDHKGETMRRYETIFIIRPNLGEDEINAIIERTSGIITNFTGTTLNVDKWGVKKLAYLVKKENQGFYVYYEYAGTPEAVAEIERLSRIDDKIMKYLTVKTQEAYVPDPPGGKRIAKTASFVDEDEGGGRDYHR